MYPGPKGTSRQISKLSTIAETITESKPRNSVTRTILAGMAMSQSYNVFAFFVRMTIAMTRNSTKRETKTMR